MAARVLAIHAHPDDCEILAGGTLALLISAGHHVTIATFTPGDCGSADLSAEEISRIRRGEAAASAQCIGSDYTCLEFRDLCVFDNDESRRRVTAVLRQERPDIVITASPVDYMCDHEAASRLVRDACFGAPAPNYDTSEFNAAEALPAIPHLYFMDPILLIDREKRPVRPDFIVDVGRTFEQKTEMLACHASQREWLRRQHGIDEYLQMMERMTRERGREAGIEFGEGLRQYKGHPYPKSPFLQDLLGSATVHNLA